MNRRSVFTSLRLQALEQRIAPAQFVVLNTANSGIGSLRQAVLDANANAGPDLITFDASKFASPQTIELATGQLEIADDLSIVGPGASLLTVKSVAVAGPTSRVIRVDLPGRVLEVTMSGFTVTGGNVTGPANFGGGVVSTDETLTLLNMVVTANQADGRGAGIAQNGAGVLTIVGSTISNNILTADLGGLGGGIANNGVGAVHLSRCTVSGNSADVSGGGVYFFNGGTFTIDSTTVQDNLAVQGRGGGIQFYGTATGGKVTVRNSTISGNIAGSEGGGIALFNFDGTFELANSTLTNNTAELEGGGIALSGAGSGRVALHSTIVSGNMDKTGGFSADISSIQDVTMSFSAVGVESGFMPIDEGNNLPFGAELKLSSLSINGGATATHLLLSGSAAIDEGKNFGVSNVDQRDEPRVNGPAADIGAVEVQSDDRPIATLAPPPKLTSPGGSSYTLTVTFDDLTAIKGSTIDGSDIRVIGPNSFDVAASLVSVDQPGDGRPRIATYQFAAPNGTWDVSDNGTYAIQLQADQVTDTAGQSAPASQLGILRVQIPTTYVVTMNVDEDDDDVNPNDLSLREAIALANGNDSPNDVIQFDPIVFATNKTIALVLGEMAITESVAIVAPMSGIILDAAKNMNQRIFTIDDQVANHAIAVSFTDISFHNAVRAGTTPNDRGGAILIRDETVSFTNCVFSANSALAGGGAVAIAVGPGAASFIRCQFLGNFTNGAGSDGGAIRASTNTFLNLQDCTLSGSLAADDGGAIYATGGNVLIESSTLNGNTSNGFKGGGAISVAGVLGQNGVVIRNSTISGNTAKANGGGIVVSGSGVIMVQNSTVVDNTATTGSGGGISRFSGSTKISIESTIVSKNSAESANDIYTANAIVNVDNSAIGDGVGFSPVGAGNLTFGLDLKLGSLADNGGPTKTHRPSSGSPVINAGSNLAGLTFDQRGIGYPRQLASRVDIGAVEVSDPSPTANVNAADVLTAGGTVYSFTVTYEDDLAVNIATIATGNVIVEGPNGFSTVPTLFSLDLPTNGTPRAATYIFSPPGGFWDVADVGNYSISMVADQVADEQGNTVQAGIIGGFQVRLSRTFIVTNDGDSGPGSLRQAILDANSVIVADSVVFDPIFFGIGRSIFLKNELSISDAITIQGPGPTQLFLNANSATRIFNIDCGGIGNVVSMSGLTLTQGLVNGNGAAIYNRDESLSLQNVTIQFCFANGGSGGGIYVADAAGSVAMANCRITGCFATGAGMTGNGGAITVFGGGSIALTRTTISGNSADEDGGGIYFQNGGSLIVNDSTISGNNAKNKEGGGIYFFGAVASAGFVIRNSTISSNSAASLGGGVALRNGFGTFVIQNSTITGNTVPSIVDRFGGGIAIAQGASTVLSLASTIVAGNFNAGAADIYRALPDSITANQSLIGVADAGNFTLIGTGNLTGTKANPLSAVLGGLINNGGPILTHALLVGSPALNAGSNPAGLAFDQRGSGFARKSGIGIDIGAYELQVAPLPPTVVGTQVNDKAIQRSMVTSLKITFSEAVSFPSGFPAAIQLAYVSGPANPGMVALAFAQSGADVLIQFDDAVYAADGGSLIDGNYSLQLISSKIRGSGGFLDGNGDGTGGDNPSSFGLHRLFGDIDGNKTISAGDFASFRLAFGGMSFAFDFDGSGSVSTADFSQFRLRFGSSLP